MAHNWKLNLNGHFYELRQELFDCSIFCPNNTSCVAAMPIGLESLALKDNRVHKNPLSDRNSWSRGIYFPVLIAMFLSGNIFRTFKMIWTKMYFCNQIQLSPSEFVFIGSTKLLNYSRENKIMFDGQFSLGTVTHGNNVPRICIQDWRLFTPSNSPSSVKVLKCNLSICSVVQALYITAIYCLLRI